MAKTVQGFANERTRLIDDLINGLEATVSKAQKQLYRRLLNKLIDKLDVKDGRIQNTNRNKGLLSSIDAVFAEFSRIEGLAIVNEVVVAIDKVITFNKSYFSELDEVGIKDLDLAVRRQMNEWLGIEKGTLKPNGYLDKLVKDSTIRKEVKDLVIKDVVSQNGLAKMQKSLSVMIEGNAEQLGSLAKYYRNFVYDTISATDRIVGMEYANSKGYEFAIYEGGIIKTSRKFCKDRNGKVFHKTEIEKFDPPTAKQANYNPFIDLGGYGCRHHLNWISTKLALRYRPEAKDFLNVNK